MEKYKKVCSEPDCFKIVTEDDIYRTGLGEIYEPTKKCWDCRTPQDFKKMKAWRKRQRGKAHEIMGIKVPPPLS